MRQAFLTTAVTGAVLVLAGCSLPPTAPVTPQLETETRSPSSAPAPTSGPTTTETASTPTPTAGEQPVASRPGSFKAVRVDAQMFPVHRSGGTATVNVYIASRSPDDTFMLFDHLGDGNTETASKSSTSVDGIRLLDTAAKKAYLPAVTADGLCVCAPDDDSTMAYINSVWVTVTFAAPPETVTSVSVSVPSFGTFADVPVL